MTGDTGIMLVQADARALPLADQSVHCVVTSPPYWGLRDYKIEGQIGLEWTIDQYVADIVQVMREVWRVLRDDGTLWLNLGDKYAMAGGPGWQGWNGQRADRRFTAHLPPRHGKSELKPKDLCGIPWRVAFALQADGWYLRSEIIWHKPNPMPESVLDRPTKAHEYLFLLSKRERYYYDAEAVKEPVVSIGRASGNKERLLPDGSRGRINTHLGISVRRNRRDVWIISTTPYHDAHFATFPPALVEPCILAGTSQRGVCPECGAPWKRVVEKVRTLDGEPASTSKSAPSSAQGAGHWRTGSRTVTTAWLPTCSCRAGDPVPATVLDPFNGAGTTGLVCKQHGRRYVGVDLNAEYLVMSRDRIAGWRPKGARRAKRGQARELLLFTEGEGES